MLVHYMMSSNASADGMQARVKGDVSIGLV
jgi:hypothetical protein